MDSIVPIHDNMQTQIINDPSNIEDSAFFINHLKNGNLVPPYSSQIAVSAHTERFRFTHLIQKPFKDKKNLDKSLFKRAFCPFFAEKDLF